MKALFTRFALLVLLVSNALLISAQPARWTARVDSLFADLNKPGRPGAAVGILHQGKLIYARGFGEADVETGASIKPETIFHVASVSKQFTAYAVVMLAQEGKVSLDDDIRKYLPEVPDFGKTITIRHLINHTSGLRDQWNLLAMAGWQLDDVITKQHVFNLVKRQKELNFEPGSAYAYCNTGYTLLAELVSRVTKQPFPTWMQEHVFKPLGMKNTLFYDNQEQLVKGRAYSFHQSPGGSSDAYRKSILSYGNVGATSLFTTVGDLALWLDNFRSPKIGSKAVAAEMLNRGRLTKGDTLPYASGLIHGKYKGLSYFGHDGADAGFRSSINYFPNEDYGFIVLSNQAEYNPGKKAFEMASLVLASKLKEEKPAKPPVVAAVSNVYPFDSTRFRAYTGSFELTEAPGFTLTFHREGDRYFLQATGQSQVEMFPSSDTTFFLKVVEAAVVFHRLKDGSVNRITLNQNGAHPGKRVQPGQKVEKPDGQFVGKYYSPELETFYTISVKNDTLKLSHVHHGEVNLRVVTKNQLIAPWWFVQRMDMVRDASDRIVGLRMNNGRVMNLWFTRLPDDFGAALPPKTGK